MDIKVKPINQLQEESKTIYRYTLFFRNSFLIFIALSFVLLMVILFARNMFLNYYTHMKDYPYLWWLQIGILLLSGGNSFQIDGRFQIPYLIIGCVLQMINWGFSAYVLHSVTSIFSSIKKGETPFTFKNASYWKKCSNAYAAMAVAYFCIAILIKPIIFLILTPILTSMFFYSLCLIFQYGSELQQESDETL